MRTVLLWLLLAGLALAGCSEPEPPPPAEPPADPETVPAPAYRPNLWLLDTARPPNAQVSSGAEPIILADRAGGTLWIGDTSGGYRSDDNGTTWHAMPPLDPLMGVTGIVDGWALAQDDGGTLYAVGLNGPTLYLGASTDGGRSWDVETPVVAASTVTDRPWLAARGEGEVAVIFWDGVVPVNAAAAGVSTGQEYCARSTDGGVTWTDRYPFAGQPQAGSLAYDADGAMYYMDNTGVAYRLPGACVETLAVQRVLGDTLDFFPDPLGANNMLQLAHDDGAFFAAAAGAGNDRLYVSGVPAWGQDPTVIDVAPPELRSNTFAAVSAHDGQVAVAWYGSETPGDPSATSFGGAFNVFVAIIDDFFGDPRIEHVRVTTEPNHVGGICMAGIGCTGDADRDLLDYFGVDHDRWGGIHVAYGHDGATGSAVVRHAHIPPRDGPEPPPLDPPAASFSYHSDGCDVRFDATASYDPDGTIASYAWDFGDGNSGQGASPLHGYDSDGAYPVELTVTDDDGLTGVAGAQIPVGCADDPGGSGGGSGDAGSGSGGGSGGDAPPQAAIGLDVGRAFVGQGVRFQDDSRDDGRVVDRQWAFGDGATSTQRHPEHTYTSTGTFTVRLTVTDDAGQSATATKSLRVVRNAPPVAAFSLDPAQPLAGQEVVLRDTSTDDGAVRGRQWDLGDGHVADTATVRHAFPAGVHTIRLTVTDDQGARQSVQKTLHVRAAGDGRAAPQVDFTISPASPEAGDRVSLRATGTASSWEWVVAGQPASGRSTAHVFDAAGAYTVRLTGTADGLSSTTSRTLVVGEAAAVQGVDGGREAPLPVLPAVLALAIAWARRR